MNLNKFTIEPLSDISTTKGLRHTFGEENDKRENRKEKQHFALRASSGNEQTKKDKGAEFVFS